MNDRTVHAVLGNNHQVVRYNRAGKWRLEGTGVSKALTLGQAVDLAVDAHLGTGDVYFGRTGGRTFDARVRKALVAGGGDR